MAPDHPAPPAGRRLAEAVQLWLLPTAGLAGAWAGWGALGVGGPVRVVAFVFPAAVSTVVVAVGVLGLWRFRVPYAVGGAPPWIGAIYAGTLNLAFAGAAALVGPGAFTGSLASAAALGAVAGGAAGVAYDVSATHVGILDPPARVRGERRGAWATVLGYGPAYFGGMGAVCGAALWAAARRFADGADGLAAWLAAASVLGATPFVAGVLVLAWRHRADRPAPTPPHPSTLHR